VPAALVPAYAEITGTWLEAVFVSGRTARRRVVRVTVPAAGSGGEGSGAPARVTASARADLLAVEEPLGIRVGGTALTVTMRTPGAREISTMFPISSSL
jgi:hypothetical protein